MINFYWCWEFALRGLQFGIAYSWHTSIQSGKSHHLSIGFILGLLVIRW